MAFTILQGTILKSLIAFEFELAALAKESKYAEEENAVVVSTIEGHSLTYLKTERGEPGKTCPISRTVVVTAYEDGQVDVVYRLPGDDIVAGVKMKYPLIAGANKTILDFLIHGIIPYQGMQ